jgi:glycyl-tRNA synthetase alpha subunit
MIYLEVQNNFTELDEFLTNNNCTITTKYDYGDDFGTLYTRYIVNDIHDKILTMLYVKFGSSFNIIKMK